jgi:hypothetical protein
MGNAFASSSGEKVEDFLKQLRRLKENFDRQLNVQEHLDSKPDYRYMGKEVNRVIHRDGR